MSVIVIPDPLSESELTVALTTLDGWSVEDGKLHKDYVFKNFFEAFGFMASAALYAEKSGHHPEWFNVYNRVRVDLVTHEAGGITSFDIELAQNFDRAAL